MTSDEIPFHCPECQCTFLETGKMISVQHFYQCETCFPNSKIRLVCEICAATCHKGHKIVDAQMASGFCDCGSGYGPEKCQRMFNFKKKMNFVNVNKSRRNNFRFIPKHICWAGDQEYVDVHIVQVNSSDPSVFIEEEEEEEKEEEEKKEEIVIEEEKIVTFEPIQPPKRREISTAKSPRRKSYVSMHESSSFDRLNRKNPVKERSNEWVRKKPPKDDRFVVFINPKKAKDDTE
ncbi:hypothetical protein TRFO_36133 [Tritrichomonas foetus]|uniref:UBR-type domain-containing protein n=1 Tax=Tritrichomonas foetus TaxID=1144522 RepID=A0A1J4JK19_9EUKA|nr:hypothetical protein TRFO_36133 [Tritrichomonas foetus]|eukprot:OHS97596.1 hypothetical protein TRFO_36133 [Tritrichomonas foetus]